MKFKYKIIYIIITAILCLSYFICVFFPIKKDLYDLGGDYSSWKVRIFCSSLYPVSVQEIHAINKNKDWTKILMGHGAGMYSSEIEPIKKIFPHYSGYGIPLNSKFASVFIQSDYGKVLPELINIYWTSVTNTRFFITKIKVNKEIVNGIKNKISYNNGKSACNPTNIDLGLLPNGDAKLWLSCAGRYRYIGKFSFSKELDENRDGNGPEVYKNYQEKINDRANYFGVDLFPIPYDKLEKTYIKKYKKDE